MDLKNYKINIYTAISFNLAIIAFLDSFVMWNDPLPGKLFTYFLKLINLFAFVFLIQRNTVHKYIWIILALPLVWMVWDERSLPLSLQYLYSTTIPIMTFLLLKDDDQVYVIRTYLKLILYVFIPGAFIYILINLIPVPHFMYVRGDKRVYENYFFLYYSLESVRFRFSSVFDEPGVIGSLSAMVVFYFRKFLSKREYIAYVVAGIFSMSLFFIIVFPTIYYFSNIRYISVRKKLIKLLSFFLAIIIFYFSFIFLINQFQDNPIIKFGIYNRFKWENGLIVGVINNRDVLPGFDESYTSLLEKKEANFWLGNGKNSVAEEFGSSGLSYRISIYEKGVIIAIYMLLLISLMQPWRKEFIFSAISFVFVLMLLFQRTLFFKIDYFILIFIGSGIVTKYAKKENSSHNTKLG